MKLIYIHHSGYAILSEGVTIIIDYYKDADNIVHDKLLKRAGKLYVLSTHSHHDHFNPEILEWKNFRADIIYVFSKEILDSQNIKDDTINYLSKLEVYKDDALSITAFGSTDIGGSFLIELEDKKIFHAGDLNNWHWNEESTEDEIKEAENYYETELEILSGNVSHINLAMFPIDPGQGKDFMKGAEQFIDNIRTDILAPMHFHGEYEKIAKFSAYAKSKNCKYISWIGDNETIEF